MTRENCSEFCYQPGIIPVLRLRAKLRTMILRERI